LEEVHSWKKRHPSLKSILGGSYILEEIMPLEERDTSPFKVGAQYEHPNPVYKV
jgi:hypothetical protein